jgi:NADH:ubiquinone oxidoreductase subunit K
MSRKPAMSLFHQYPLQHYLLVGAILFAAGLYTILTRRNAVSILMGIELILNGANVNFVAFGRYAPAAVPGGVFVVFIILIAAAEAAVALAIILGIYKNFGTTDVDETRTLSG